MTRPDDPYVIQRNPALLADLGGSQLYLNSFIGLVGACSQLSGGWGWGYHKDSVISTGTGEPPLFSEAEEGMRGGSSQGESLDLSPSVLPYSAEPFPEICYSGGAVLIPSILLTTKLGESIGVGIGFVPPEVSQSNQMGNSDGTVDTNYGKRPNPLRYLEPAFRETTYFGLLGAIGYRVLPWLRVGAGLRWTMILVDLYSFSNSGTKIDPVEDVKAHFYGQDLFIPGFITSIHIVPMDSLDIALGFRWEDSIFFKEAKIDISSAPFSYYSAEQDWFYYQEAGSNQTEGIGGFADVITHNIPGTVSAPPIAVPQLSFGFRYADRIRPRPTEYSGLKRANDSVRDPMADERWDIEFNAVYYFTSVLDHQAFTTNGIIEFDKEHIKIRTTDAGSEMTKMDSLYVAGIYLEKNDDDECVLAEQTPVDFKGKDQISLRIGGDYNLIPDVFAVRIGVSYETRGQDPGYARPTWSLPFERIGIHNGITWRVDGRTDLSIAYAHFFQETIKLALGQSDSDLKFPEEFTNEVNEKGEVRQLSTEEINEKYHVISKDEADDKAQIPIYNALDQGDKKPEYGKYKGNAGTHKFGLDVISISIMRHF